MNFRFTVIESSLNRVEFRWKWIRFLRWSFVLGSVIALVMLGLGVAMHKGYLTDRDNTVACVVIISIIAFLAWAVVLISVAAGSPERAKLANDLESADPRLMDRVNTLLYLEQQGKQPGIAAFARRIANQVQHLFVRQAPPPVYPYRPALASLTVMIGCALITCLFYVRYSPFRTMMAAHLAAVEAAANQQPEKPATPAELALPPIDNVEQKEVWGEVRITDPATDMRVTKVDVVPLQIEAAANQALEEVSWVTSINGSTETPNKLPPPAEPRYAVYQPTVYLDEYQLSDWDVMTYYARAKTEKQNSYASDVYFLEVRPFREDILKIPGGEGGQAYQCLNELTSLINRQQHIIRQTHGFAQNPPKQETLRLQDQKKLSAAEKDLSEATKHFYAQLSSRMENKPIGEALDTLAKAEQSLAKAADLLNQDALTEAQGRERQALAELVAARKMFQKAISDNPQQFDEKQEEQPEVADTAEALKQMAEYRNETKAARDFVQQTSKKQKDLQTKAATQARSTHPQLAKEEQALRDALQKFQEEHPQPFKDSQEESKQALDSMSAAAQKLERRDFAANTSMTKAGSDLEKLQRSMDEQAASQQLSEAYKLKQMLDQQAKALDQASKPDSSRTQQQNASTAAQAKETLNRLADMTRQEPTRSAFGEPLRESLDPASKKPVDQALSDVQMAQDKQQQQAAAARASAGLQKISQAFTQSEPKSLQAARKENPLKPGEQDPFGLGLAELDSLLKRLQDQRAKNPEDLAKQGQEALYNLQTGMREEFGNNEAGNQILLQLQKALKDQTPPDPVNLQKLLDELHRFSLEMAAREDKRTNDAQVVNIDPARLPPAYRGRIQKYFEKLSEK